MGGVHFHNVKLKISVPSRNETPSLRGCRS